MDVPDETTSSDELGRSLTLPVEIATGSGSEAAVPAP